MQGDDQLCSPEEGLRDLSHKGGLMKGEIAGLGRRSEAGRPAGQGNPGNLGDRKGSRQALAMMRLPPSTPAPPERGMCHRYEEWIDQYLLLGTVPFAGLGCGCVSAGSWWIFQKHPGSLVTIHPHPPPPLAPEQSSGMVPPFAVFSSVEAHDGTPQVYPPVASAPWAGLPTCGFCYLFFPHMPLRLPEVHPLMGPPEAHAPGSPPGCPGATLNSPCLWLDSPPPYNSGSQWWHTQTESCASSLPPGQLGLLHSPSLLSHQALSIPPPHWCIHGQLSMCHYLVQFLYTPCPGPHSCLLLGSCLQPDSSTLPPQTWRSS